ncbi:SDR family NAD(P)-dependent oxidoreductase [Novosphingobium taihuense]|uniref:NAD(P)-dependent dehydrogenase (Short-subunit alcohol dehydrogenase family) n=1 Tax=Novosphingobium taihuense TaxID=260085 RepID=A0A7W7ADI8_9SPHN|nr:SDR family oxidoreductase [Novosphingobium taihuense]MBB4614280.1 NAD(P)-dependent dehydrogenase (short-subunit alcohol dehydrogenase family) [Novosphingobium taihuense]TWH87127.1 NAD(P)-dependent dehydrogenase (short-subunit alcohol dehydrogenase family) [Novosphingobium taihuense]
MDLELNGKRALVTGSSSGIGAATAKLLGAEGARVMVHGRGAERAKAVAQSIIDAGGQASYVLGDLSNEAVCTDVAKQVLEEFGGIDILVNNAGGSAAAHRPDTTAEVFNRAWLDTPWDDWRWTYEQNVGSSVRLIQAFAPGMIERGWGRIINMSSAAATQTEPDLADYQPAKAAITNMTSGLAKSLSGTGITVNSVTPGTIATEGVRAGFVEWAKQLGWTELDWPTIERRFTHEVIPQPTKHFGRPIDIARMVAFLASPQASYMTGANYRVDGGQCRSIN